MRSPIAVSRRRRCRRHRSARVRAGRSHPIAGARAGSHPEASRSWISRGRSRAAVCVAGRRRRLSVRVRISVEAGVAAAASAKDAAAPCAREESARHRHQARRGAPARARSASRQAPRRQRVGRIFESDDARARVAALAGIAAHRAARERHQSVPAGGRSTGAAAGRSACARSLWCTRASSRRRRRNLCSRLLRAIASSATRVRCLTDMIRGGELRRDIVDGVSYVSPADAGRRRSRRSQVRFLAPFDPVVWDRARFEHLWGWAVSLRGVHAGEEARARLLRDADAVAG